LTSISLISITDTAIFSSSLSKHLGADIAAAVLPLGLSPRYLAAFIGALAGQDEAALAQIPGVTPQIIGAGVGALKHAYLISFRGIWITAAVFSFVTAIGKWHTSLLSFVELVY
jgi:hypothetical protein